MAEFNQVVIFVTVGTREEAEVIADVLLEQNKVACVNIVPAVDSHFNLEGKAERRQEVLLIIKTRASLVDEVASLVKTIHSYDVPEVIALPIIGGNPEYLAWIDNETETE
jgi:periplasmic divalent cation tolerance protein